MSETTRISDYELERGHHHLGDDVRGKALAPPAARRAPASATRAERSDGPEAGDDRDR